jgi:serine/threonine protein kinase
MQYSVSLKGQRKTIKVNQNNHLGRGATASVYRVLIDSVDYAAKIYHSPGEFNVPKIREMIFNPPSECEIVRNGQVYPQFAWPKSVLLDSGSRECGILLPLVDPKESFSLDHYFDQALFGKLNSPDEAALSYKLEIAENLAKIVSDLHAHQHYFIDCKPQNIRVFKRSHIVTLLDCDGFSIKGGSQRYPAELLSTDYIAPEVQRTGQPASQLGVDQDLYALAVIFFQLLNRGTHPFQGIVNDKSVVGNTNDDKAAQGLYPHGLSANPRIRPRPSSIHHLWDRKTRVLFDRAFSTGASSTRPSASEWAGHFEELLISKALVRCDKFPTNIEHMRFRGVDCPACYLSSIDSFKPTKFGQVGVQTVATSLGQSSAASAASMASSTSAGSSGSEGWWLAGIAACICLFTIFTDHSNSPSPATPPTGEESTASNPTDQRGQASVVLEYRRPEVGQSDKKLLIQEERWCSRLDIRYKAWVAYDKAEYSRRLANAYLRDRNLRCAGRIVTEEISKQVKAELSLRKEGFEKDIPETIRTTITSLQLRLSEQGFDPGALDGRIGPSTILALQSFRAARGLPTEDAALDELVARTRLGD